MQPNSANVSQQQSARRDVVRHLPVGEADCDRRRGGLTSVRNVPAKLGWLEAGPRVPLGVSEARPIPFTTLSESSP